VFEDLAKVMEEEGKIINKKDELTTFLSRSSKTNNKLGAVEKLVQEEIEKINVQLVAIKVRKNKLLKEKEDIEEQLQVNVTQIMASMVNKERKMKEKGLKQKMEKKKTGTIGNRKKIERNGEIEDGKKRKET